MWTCEDKSQGVFHGYVEKPTKECRRRFNIVSKSTPRVPGDRPLILIIYKYIYHKFLGFNAMEGGISKKLGVPYLSRYPENCSNVYISPVVCNKSTGRNFSACNAIYNHSTMRQYDIAL